MNKACRIKFLIRSVPQFSIHGFAFFSSNSAANPRFVNVSTDGGGVEESWSGGISTYRHALRHQRPSTIRWKPELQNTVSFIGSVDRAPKSYKMKGKAFGAYTFINAMNSGDPNRTFRIPIELWDDMAKVAIQHLKRNDTIYVSGYLGYYKNADKNGNLIHYKIIVKELSYVAQLGQQSTSQKPEESLVQAFQKSEQSESKASKKLEELQSKTRKKSEESISGGANLGEIGIEKYTNHLYLWQLFFCKPYEWWDKRENKQNSSAPDFKHKFTGECLWLRHDDPPWVQKQLLLLDMEMANQRQANRVVQSGLDSYKNHHHLWQVFFSNPHEWWDNRKNKKHSQGPDFKHKDTGEALWIRPNDPPWVKRQLQLLDSRTEEQCLGSNVGSHARVSEWLSDD